MYKLFINHWVEFIFGIATTSLGFAYKRLKCEINKYKALEDGMQTILRCQLYMIYNEAIDNGYCPVHKKEQAEDIYTSYHNIGANGTGTQVYNDIMSMKTRPKNKEKEVIVE